MDETIQNVESTIQNGDIFQYVTEKLTLDWNELTDSQMDMYIDHTNKRACRPEYLRICTDTVKHGVFHSIQSAVSDSSPCRPIDAISERTARSPTGHRDLDQIFDQFSIAMGEANDTSLSTPWTALSGARTEMLLRQERLCLMQGEVSEDTHKQAPDALWEQESLFGEAMDEKYTPGRCLNFEISIGDLLFTEIDEQSKIWSILTEQIVSTADLKGCRDIMFEAGRKAPLKLGEDTDRTPPSTENIELEQYPGILNTVTCTHDPEENVCFTYLYTVPQDKVSNKPFTRHWFVINGELKATACFLHRPEQKFTILVDSGASKPILSKKAYIWKTKFFKNTLSFLSVRGLYTWEMVRLFL